MATIRASCDSCGDVEFPTSQVRVHAPDQGGPGSYSFRCPTCHRQVVRTAERPIMDLLIAAGVVATPSPRQRADAGPPPLTHAELLEFEAQLHDDAALGRALDALARTGPAGGDLTS